MAMNNFENRNNTQKESDRNITQGMSEAVVEITPEPFPKENASVTMLRTDLCKVINRLFASVFGDYEGCDITFARDNMNNMTGGLTVVLSFIDRPIGPDKLKAIAPAGAEVEEGKLSEIKKFNSIINQRNRGRVYEFTKEAKNFLEDYVPYRMNNKNQKVIRWNDLSHERIEENYMYMPNNKKVIGLAIEVDINVCMKTIYGKKSERGSMYDYDVSVSNLLPSFSGTPEMLLNITQYDREKVKELLNKVGMLNGGNRSSFVTSL